MSEPFPPDAKHSVDDQGRFVVSVYTFIDAAISGGRLSLFLVPGIEKSALLWAPRGSALIQAYYLLGTV
jgi:hypothetical protein